LGEKKEKRKGITLVFLKGGGESREGKKEKKKRRHFSVEGGRGREIGGSFREGGEGAKRVLREKGHSDFCPGTGGGGKGGKLGVIIEVKKVHPAVQGRERGGAGSACVRRKKKKTGRDSWTSIALDLKRTGKGGGISTAREGERRERECIEFNLKEEKAAVEQERRCALFFGKRTSTRSCKEEEKKKRSLGGPTKDHNFPRKKKKKKKKREP